MIGNDLVADIVKSRMIMVRDNPALIDRDVAELYGVQTREINQAVRNNPDKFPEGYVCELTKEESASLRSKILTLESNTGRGKYSNELNLAVLKITHEVT
jgi:hypothetical protein